MFLTLLLIILGVVNNKRVYYKHANDIGGIKCGNHDHVNVRGMLRKYVRLQIAVTTNLLIAAAHREIRWSV